MKRSRYQTGIRTLSPIYSPPSTEPVSKRRFEQSGMALHPPLTLHLTTHDPKPNDKKMYGKKIRKNRVNRAGNRAVPAKPRR